MITKEEINVELLKVMKPDLIKLWWGLRIPGLGPARPEDVFKEDPARLMEYVKSYLDPSFS